jgi:dethiobiotin synthetase
VGFKPLSTGDRSDAIQIAEAAHHRLSLAEVNPAHFALPLSPWQSARRAEATIDLPALITQIKVCAAPHSPVVVEGVGGWLAPLSAQFTVRDLAVGLGYPVIIVTRVALGTLNHTLLTVESIRATGLPILGLVINLHGCQDPLILAENPGALVELTGLPSCLLASDGRLPDPLPFGLDELAGIENAVRVEGSL